MKFPPLGDQVKALLVWPEVPKSFWTILMPGAKERSAVPPLGLLTIAALCPKSWTIRFIDEQVEEVRDEHVREAELVMVSGMQVQKDSIKKVLLRARALRKRTIIGGPYVSSEPDSVLPLADHIVIGEPDAVFRRIAAELECGTGQRVYVVDEKPDVTCTPVPRFDLLKMDRYATMAVQFSRGCPFQCEFCDIISLYGRTPRTKQPEQVLAELESLFKLGWRKPVFMVDDNFIGNQKRTVELLHRLQGWSESHNQPFSFFTEASIDLAQRPALVDAMVKANFFGVFVGIESPSPESLKETKKFQNLRADPIESIKFLNAHGLWVSGGFIIGFDSDKEDIFERQREFVERTAIPWAMLAFLQAPPTTPLYRRMQQEGRITDDFSGNFNLPNFRTMLPFPVLVEGFSETLRSLYGASSYFNRCFHSLSRWTPQGQKPPALQLLPAARMLLSALWYQGICSDYRSEWWKSVYEARRWIRDPMKRWMALLLLASGHHFIHHSRKVVSQLHAELRKAISGQLDPATAGAGNEAMRPAYNHDGFEAAVKTPRCSEYPA